MFGLFKPPGKIEIQTDKMSYSFGETIKGKVKLEMTEAKTAKALRLSFVGSREVPYTDKNGRRKKRTQEIHAFRTDLDGEHEYSGAKEYDFEVKVPAQQELKLPGGTLGQIAGVAIAAAQAAGIAPSQVKWHITAKLDIAMGQDVSKQVQVGVA